MDSTQAQHLMLRGYISMMKPAEQEKVKDCAAKIKAIIKEAGPEGYVALAVAAHDVGAAKESDLASLF